MFRHRRPTPLADRGPLRVAFVETEMTTGGEEVLLVEILRRLDRSRFLPELVCLKSLGELGENLVGEVPVFHDLIAHKFDVGIWRRLAQLFTTRRIDAAVTVGTGGDKMFWGRLAAWRAGVPVIASAIHSTSYPNRVELPNRLLAPLTDAFIAVAEAHGHDITKYQGCPAHKVRVVPNGVDVERFQPRQPDAELRRELGLPTNAPVAGIVAEIRPEKNHRLFLGVARRVRELVPESHFLVVGDGPLRAQTEAAARELGVDDIVHFCGRRHDIPQILSNIDVFLLTSDMEANPVSILEALASGTPVVSTRVGSIPETVLDDGTGYLAEPHDEAGLSAAVARLLSDADLRTRLGLAGRQLVTESYSVESMVGGYERLLSEIYEYKSQGGRRGHLQLNEPNTSAGLTAPREEIAAQACDR